MNAEESTGSDKSKKTKPKPRTRRTKSEVPCSQNLTVTVAGDDTDPRTVCSNEDVSVGAASGANYSDIPNEAIRPRSSSRRRAYIIKRPQSAPIFGRVTPRSFPSDELDGADKSSPKTCQGSATSSPDNDTSHAVSTTTSGLSGTFPEPKNDSATKMASSEPKSLVCKQITVPAVPQSASSVICYGRTKPLQKENSVDRKEHVEVSVSETIFIHTIKSNSKIQPRPNFSDAPKTSPLFNGKDGDSVPVDSCAQTNVINSQLYAQVIKPKHAAIEISLDSGSKRPGSVISRHIQLSQ
ncbi:hypothetical protein EGW08_005151 [Elysia chlorotica]|uniref:Uncharacterized protein n=1 Tax=Elysia chlorotica TaxID=188477 RepID=A0A3S0ZVP0_ELYCH|nr:hypothetical protein EGW08_005151 [Elysia chlorotica]